MFKLFYLVTGMSVFLSCRSANDYFVINGHLVGHHASKTVYLFEADSAGFKAVDSALIQTNGQFNFSNTTFNPQIYKIVIDNNDFNLIVKNGEKIDFRTDLSDSTHEYKIGGSAESLKLLDYRKIASHFDSSRNMILKAFQNDEIKGVDRDKLLKKYIPFIKAIADSADQLSLQFIQKNKQTLAGVFVASTLDEVKNESVLVKYAKELKLSYANSFADNFKNRLLTLAPTTVGSKGVGFSIKDINGKTVSLNDYKGKYVLIDFWASWCPPCRAENPNVVRIFHQYQTKGLNILGVSLDTDINAWRKAVAADGLAWTQTSDLAQFDGVTEKLYHIEVIPSNFLIGPDGVIVAKNVFGDDLEILCKRLFK
ncbi:AhpC/TSA family protein [Mucilaginibacter rigui]|uniref:AhpC/TSA family protein n=1 Tax=Mucilaginibacter rigui TaxID=534635 RepID=A0ABR7X7Y9_9SPHI|nr:TlpA disulfide reductase family protein [Mucilaginibacter rigui]MBD1386713.1 AhpC/TSA family protein [Mucilaginibacter rigui]